MRLVQTLVPDESRETVVAMLNDEGMDYAIADDAGGKNASSIYVPLPTGAVEDLLANLHDAGLDEDAFTIVTEIETATTPRFAELEERYSDDSDDEDIAHEELRTQAREMSPATPRFVIFAAMSAVVATAGLLLNSATIIVGAMVISPFAGASLSASVGAVSNDPASALEGVKSQLLGLVVVIVSAVGASLLFRWGFVLPPAITVSRIGQVSSFATPTVLALTIAVVVGAAGALALVGDLSEAIIGVAVAAAIVPAAATAGIALVWGNPSLALGALALLLANVILINLTAFVALWALDYRSFIFGDVIDNLSFDFSTVLYVAVAVVLVAILIITVFSMYQYFTLSRTVNQNVNEVFTEPEYDQLELGQVNVAYGTGSLFGASGSVTVVVGRPADENYPRLSETIQRRINAVTNQPVTVEVRFVEYQRTAPPSSSALTLGQQHGGIRSLTLGLDRLIPTSVTVTASHSPIST
ncbi:MAG TPA: TIGR00341 family protein [Halococcus sp.]|nr:TIGR00341 family protein [Halococcus sp.]